MIEEGKFYFIKDEYFDLFKDYKLMQNKENGTKRPCYFCFKDKVDDDIVWFVPISTKYEKYEKIYENKKKQRSKVFNFVFGEVLGKKAVFLIQNIFPVIDKFVQEKYKTAGKDVNITEATKKKVIAYSRQVIHMADCGINIAFNDINKMKKVLIKDVIMKDKILRKRRNERISCKEYFKVKYGSIPEFMQLPKDPPDCYVVMNGERIAVEATSCYMDNDEENDFLYKKALKEHMKSETPLLNIYKHVGKKFIPNTTYTLICSNKENLVKELLSVKEHIKLLTINRNNVWLNGVGIICSKLHEEEKDFETFLNAIEEYKDVYLELINKHKKETVLKFHVIINDLIVKYENVEYKVGETYVFWDNDNAKLESLKNAIQKKVDEYDKYIRNMKDKNLEYSKYILVIDYLRIPCNFDNYEDVYEFLKKELKDFKYDEIAILFSNNVMCFNNDMYEIK